MRQVVPWSARYCHLGEVLDILVGHRKSTLARCSRWTTGSPRWPGAQGGRQEVHAGQGFKVGQHTPTILGGNSCLKHHRPKKSANFVTDFFFCLLVRLFDENR